MLTEAQIEKEAGLPGTVRAAPPAPVASVANTAFGLTPSAGFAPVSIAPGAAAHNVTGNHLSLPSLFSLPNLDLKEEAAAQMAALEAVRAKRRTEERVARATAANRSRLSASSKPVAAQPSIERHSSTEMGAPVHPALVSPERVRALGMREAELKAEIQLLEAQVELAIQRSPRHHSLRAAREAEGGSPSPRFRQAGRAASGQQGSSLEGSSERHSPRSNSANRMPPHTGGLPVSHVQRTVDERLQSIIDETARRQARKAEWKRAPSWL